MSKINELFRPLGPKEVSVNMAKVGADNVIILPNNVRSQELAELIVEVVNRHGIGVAIEMLEGNRT